MKKLWWMTLALGAWANIGVAQEAEPGAPFIVDTIAVDHDTILMYSDKTWEYLSVLNFNGVTCPHVHELVTSDTNYQFVQDWNTEMPFTHDNDVALATMTDSIWTCTVDSLHKDWCIPFEGPVISTFKHRGRRFHYGIDIDLVTGDPVRAAFSGRVRYAQYNKSGFGNLVIIRHYNGLETYYAHFDKLKVVPNQEVKAGEIIGLGGNTGRSTGSHLHFEVRFYHNPINPETIFDFKNKTLKDENLFVHKDLFSYRKISSSSSRPSSSSTPSANGDVKTHRIRSGDSLYKIALKYGTSVDALCRLNDMKKSEILRIGRVLKVK